MSKERLIELAKQAGWEYADDDRGFEPLWTFAELVRADALAEQPAPVQQEPVAIALNTGTKQGVKWLKNVEHGERLYTSPPAQRKPLTDEEIGRLWSQSLADTEGETYLPLREFAKAIEAKLRSKNT